MPIEFTVDNVGFGELFNPRDVEVVLRNTSTGETQSVALTVDPRWWSGGTNASVSTQLLLPEGLEEGAYTVALWMPDADASLRDDPRYAVRFANAGVWEASTGFNVLTTSLVVDAEAPGPAFVSAGLAEVVDLGGLTLAGDFNLDGTVDAADYTVWRDQGMPAAEYDRWLANFGAVLPSATTAVPEPVGLAYAAVAAVLAASGRRRPRGR